MSPTNNTDRHRLVAQPAVHVDPVDDLIARRLYPARVAADRVAILERIDDLGRAGASTFGVVAKSIGFPGCIAFIDGAPAARDFVVRFLDHGVPAVWHAGCVVQLTVHGIDPTDAESCRQ